MIPAEYYQTIYLIIVSLMTLGVYNQYANRNGLREFKHSNLDIVAGGLALFMALFIGLRPVSVVFADMVNYANWYELIYEGANFHFIPGGSKLRHAVRS